MKGLAGGLPKEHFTPAHSIGADLALRCLLLWCAAVLPRGRAEVHGHHLLPCGQGVRPHMLPGQHHVRQRRVQAAQEVWHGGEPDFLQSLPELQRC